MSETSGTGIDARLDTRYPASAVPSIVCVRLSPGDAVELVNISKSGVLVEGRTRFVPGTRVTVIFEGGFTPPSTKARVIRCQVSSIVWRRLALPFRHPVRTASRRARRASTRTTVARAGTRLRDARVRARTARRPGEKRVRGRSAPPPGVWL